MHLNPDSQNISTKVRERETSCTRKCPDVEDHRPGKFGWYEMRKNGVSV